MYIDAINAPPIPADPVEFARWEHTRLRRRMLYGGWDNDLKKRVRKLIGNVRSEAQGTPDMSSNVFRAVVSQLSVLYDVPPIVGGSDELAAAVEEVGLWSLMTRVQRDTLGLRDMLLRVDLANDGRLTYRPVFPDLVEASPYADRPEQPIKLKEARKRDGRWCWDVFDLTDPAFPVYRVESSDGADLTLDYLGVPSASGENYPYRSADGSPYLPYSIYHAAESATLWDTYEARELIEGALNVGVLFSLFSHAMRSASWPQRWAVGVELGGAAYIDEDGDGEGRSEVVTDPATVLMLRAAEEGIGGQPMIGQWQAGADPLAMQEAIVAYERRVAAFAGLSGSDILRQSGDPRSGYAISVSRSAQREAQRRYEPMFRRADLNTLEISAALLGLDVKRSDLAITYAGIPLSVEERKAEIDEIVALLEAGLIDRATAYQMRHPETSRDQALLAVEEIARVNRRIT